MVLRYSPPQGGHLVYIVLYIFVKSFFFLFFLVVGGNCVHVTYSY